MNRLGQAALALAAAGVGGWLLTRVRRARTAVDFRGKVFLITGGSRGLGLVLAREAASEGARVAVCARDQEELDRAAGDLAQHGESPLALRCDLADPQQVQDMVRAVEAHFGPVDVLINNASIITVGPLETMTRQDFEENLAINFWGTYNATEAVLPSMRARQEGRIVNISSIGGKIAVPHLLPYDVSKFAVAGYSAGLRAELARYGIVVATVCPGLMLTGSPPNAQFKGQHRAEYSWFAVGDSIPFLTMSAESAARQVLDACRHGDAEIVLTFPAKVATTIHGVFPGLVTDLLALVNRLLPAPGGIGTQKLPGKESESPVAPSLLTTLTEKAARRNNELAPGT